MPDDSVVINTSKKSAEKPAACVIWMHGLGADGNDFAPIVPQLGLPQSPGVRFVFPNAPSLPVTINGGYVMPAWYDIRNLESLERDVDSAGLAASCERILGIAQIEAAGVGWGRLVIAGFSQGGSVAAQLLDYLPQRPAGLLCLSTYAAAPLKPAFDPAGLPALVMHGELDPVVPPQLGEALATHLRNLGLSVQHATYPMAHQVCLEQIEEIGAWLAKVLRLA